MTTSTDRIICPRHNKPLRDSQYGAHCTQFVGIGLPDTNNKGFCNFQLAPKVAVTITRVPTAALIPAPAPAPMPAAIALAPSSNQDHLLRIAALEFAARFGASDATEAFGVAKWAYLWLKGEA